MVNNLRQSGSARTMLMKWRSFAAAKREETTCDIKVQKKDKASALSSDINNDVQKVADNVLLLKYLLKDKFGLNTNLTLRQQQYRLKSENFGKGQQNSLEFIHRSVVIPLGESDSVSMVTLIPDDILQKSLRPNLDWDTEKCKLLSIELLSKTVSSTHADRKDDCDVKHYQDNSCDPARNGSLKETVLVDDEKEIQLTRAQEKVVEDLKAAIEAGQLLGFLQGFPGAGKTTTSKRMSVVTGLRVLFCGSTGTASAQFYSRTVHSFLSLGMSVDKIDLAKETTSAGTISKVVAAVENYDLILIDEASMITPVTLARIDLRLRHCFNSELPFGGKHIILCGDMWQFPPVSGL